LSSVRQRLQGQPGQSGRFISETKVESGAITLDRYPGIELLQEELTPLKVVFAQE
jgi:hypothetical protein